MALFTNVEAVTQDAVAIAKVKSVSVNEEINPLESQSDGARGPEIVGELANTFAITVEIEDEGLELDSIFGTTNKGTFVFKTSQDDDKAKLTTHTITNIVFLGRSRSTDNTNPGGISLTGRNVGNNSVETVTPPA